MSTPIIVDTTQKTFKFINEFDPDDSSYYNITINITEIHYTNGLVYYDIRYYYHFTGVHSSKKQIHPFYRNPDEIASSDGVIVIKNKMTETMTTFLLADTEILQKLSGLTTAQTYRTNIMLMLSMLWD